LKNLRDYILFIEDEKVVSSIGFTAP